MTDSSWPYPLSYGEEETISCDVLVLGGGVAGCMAECPHGAIRLRHPLMNRVRWVERSKLRPAGE